MSTPTPSSTPSTPQGQRSVPSRSTSPDLSAELWHLILSSVPLAHLWASCRLVSPAFKSHANFILRTTYIARQLKLMHSTTSLQFSHFSNDNTMAYFKPSFHPVLTPELLHMKLGDRPRNSLVILQRYDVESRHRYSYLDPRPARVLEVKSDGDEYVYDTFQTDEEGFDWLRAARRWTRGHRVTQIVR
jgi:hypothetical protein